MNFIIIIGIIFAFIMFPTLRVIVFNPFATVKNAIVDLYKYFRYKKWRVLKTGKLICYCALFGKGKTLTVAHYIAILFKKYHNKLIWDEHRKKWVMQKLHIISNIEFKDLPYEQFVSLAQVIRCAEEYHSIDEKNDTLTCHLLVGDEFSVQMNSRSFKTNISPLFLNTLLTCRHHHITLVYDAQRFNHVDALLRQVTSYVVQCDKKWRIVRTNYYDAYELECANNPQNVRPIKKSGWFVRDADYNRYDTLACVGNLQKSCENGDMLSDEEILSLQCNMPSDMESVSKQSRKYRRRMKKLHK